jgi:PKD repeat protein
MKTRNSSILLLLILFLLCSVVAFAQDPIKLKHSSELFLIDNDTVFIKGSLQQDQGNSNKIFNLGDIYVSDSIINYGDVNLFGILPDTSGKVFFNGNTRQIMEGKSIYYSFAYLQNTFDSLRIEADTIFINAQLVLDQGNLDVDSQYVFLNRINYNGTIIEGSLINEDADDNVFGYPGYVVIDRQFTTGSVLTDLHGTGLDLTIDGSLGKLEIRRYNKEQTSASNGSIERFFEFYPTTADQVSNPGIFYLDPTNLNGNNEDSLAMFLSQDGGLSYRDNGGNPQPNIDIVSAPAFSFTLGTKTRLTLSEDSCKTLPMINIIEDTIPLCSGSSAFIKAEGTTGMEIFWSTGQLNLDSIQVSAPGKYGIVIVDEKGCPNKDSVEVISAPDPIVGFRSLPVCDGDSVQFIDTSSISSGTISSFWDFNDPFNNNDTTSSIDPKYKYKQLGTYQSKLKVTSNYGCVVELVKPVVVLPQPVADFNFSGSCAGADFTFTNQSVLPGQQSRGLLYEWVFTVNDTSNAMDTSFVFNTTGSYPVQLAIQSNGCTDTVTKTVQVNDAPLAQFSVSNVCFGNAVSFQNQTTVTNGTVSYSWDLGNGSNSVDTTPIENYVDTGRYAIQLIAVSSFGCSDTVSSTVVVNEVPQVNFSFLNACLQDSVAFINSSVNQTSSLNYVWNFGNSTSSILENPKVKYAANGNYTVQLIATNDSLCVDSISKNISVFPEPTASFNVSDVCDGDAVNFQNTSAFSNGALSYKWLFGNGDSSSSLSPNKIYPMSGTYQVTLIASTASACQDSITNTVTVNSLPNVFIGDTLTTCGNSLVLDAQNTGSTFSWSTGDVSQSITAVANGTYSVTVTDAIGCSDKDDALVSLFTPIQINLPANVASCDSFVLKTLYPSSGNTFNWNNSANTNNITILNSGTYSVTLTDQNGCTGSASSSVTINTSPIVDLGIDQTKCADTAIVFDALNIGSSYLWSNGSVSQSISTLTQGRYSVTVTDINGCSSNDNARAIFNVNPVLDLGLDRVECDSATLAVSTSGLNYLWNNSSINSSILVNQTGVYSVRVSDANSCVSLDTVSIRISNSPIVDLGMDTTICSGASINIGSNVNGSTYLWSNGKADSSIQISSSNTYQLTVTNTDGCTGSDDKMITVNSPLILDLGADKVICEGGSYQLDAQIPNATYNWSGPLGYNSNEKMPIVLDTGKYYLSVTDQFGCSISDSVKMIKSGSQLTADYLVNTDLIAGDTLIFINLSYPKPFTAKWDFDDGFISLGKNPLHTYFVDGTYNAKLVVENGACRDSVVKQLIVLPRRIKDIQDSIDVIGFNEFLKLALYPNPNSGQFSLELELITEDFINIDFYNMNGQHMGHDQLRSKDAIRTYNQEGVAPGFYFARITTPTLNKTIKFIIVK